MVINPGGNENPVFFPFRLGMVAILFSLAQMQSIHLVRCPRGMGREGGNASFYIHVHAFIIVWCTVYAKWEYHGIDIHITRDRDLLPSFSFVRF